MKTQHEKTLAIAKVMYGEKSIEEDSIPGQFSGMLYRVINKNTNKVFKPYTSAEGSQAVQEFFKLNIEYDGEYVTANTNFRTQLIAALGLKTAIANCAYEVVKEK